MVNDPEAVNMVETIIRKGKPFFSIGDFESARDPEQGKTLLCKLYRPRRQINPHVVCSISCELDTISRYATSDFQHVLLTKRGEPGHDRYVPLATLITFSGDVLEISSAVLFGR